MVNQVQLSQRQWSLWNEKIIQLERRNMSLGTILVILLVLALVGVLPTWGYSTSWGYAPGGIVGLLLVIVIILALLGRL
jgi:hypothetical protein